ncbi:hypothetical protein M409DRAFT_26000 [Zasmidium cellare ATCC 36951]|uniref:Uncharacterized protein n=1 Tax=Zasmidium cellare ATCC 36951 TaxID=1080233 RepID=A0A6A6CDU7_ZASCE|nr:uncharacterized protein M409DRAFT_26000 [Zasmidium cellare ATCC 36951]KAF2163819.1 hypothetical protein M409DRAFT_26000 [Zasmidium cellare ATCC 36951]
MSYLEKAAVDADMVEGWEEFQRQWAGKKKAEEELKWRQQEYQREQQSAAQQQQQQQQPRQAKPATGPRNASSKAAAGGSASANASQYRPLTEAEALALRVLDAKQNLDDQTRAYDRARWQYPKPPLFVVNALAHAVKRAQDELANAQQVEDIARRARLARAKAANQQQGASSSTATQGAAKNQPAQQSTSKTATPKPAKATQPSKTTTPVAKSENPFAVDPAFLARIKAMNEAAQKKSASLQNKSDAEAEADLATKRRKAEQDEAFLESLKQGGTSAGSQGKGKQKATDADPPAQPSKYQAHPRYVSPTVEDAMGEGEEQKEKTKTRKKKTSGSGIKKKGVVKSTTKKKKGPFIVEKSSDDEEEEEEDLYS